MTKFCLWVDIWDVMTYATFGDNRLRGLGVARGRISPFPIDLCRRPYTTMHVCNYHVCKLEQKHSEAAFNSFSFN